MNNCQSNHPLPLLENLPNKQIKGLVPLTLVESLKRLPPEWGKWAKAGENGFELRNKTNNRGSDRASLFTREVADKLSYLLRPHVPTLMMSKDTPMVGMFDRSSIWAYEGVNPLLRYISYPEQTGVLFTHYDVPYVYDDQEFCTLLSVVIYLETGTGGNTRFIKGREAKFKELPLPDWTRDTNEEEVDSVVDATVGDVLIFPHTRLHDSSLVTQGRKTIIRTDITYRRILTE